MPDRLRGIEVFVAAARLGGLSAAGRSLRLSPAMAAKHLDALEHRLGVKLLHRSTRRLTLTDAGRRFLERSEALLQGLADAEGEASAAAEEVAGRLRVTVPVSFGVIHVVPLIPAFTAQHPKLAVELDLNDRHVALADEDWDTAIRVGRLEDSELIAQKLAPTTTVLAASPDYIARWGAPETAADLRDHNCLGYTLSEPLGVERWRFGPEGEVSVPVRGDLVANNGAALVAAAVAGQGLVYGPRFLAGDALRSGALVEIDLDVAPVGGGAVYALTHPSRRAAAKTDAWIAFLKARLAPRIADL